MPDTKNPSSFFLMHGMKLPPAAANESAKLTAKAQDVMEEIVKGEMAHLKWYKEHHHTGGSDPAYVKFNERETDLSSALKVKAKDFYSKYNLSVPENVVDVKVEAFVVEAKQEALHRFQVAEADATLKKVPAVPHKTQHEGAISPSK